MAQVRRLLPVLLLLLASACASQGPRMQPQEAASPVGTDLPSTTSLPPYDLNWEVGCLVQLSEELAARTGRLPSEVTVDQNAVVACAEDVQRMTPTEREVFKVNWVPGY